MPFCGDRPFIGYHSRYAMGMISYSRISGYEFYCICNNLHRICALLEDLSTITKLCCSQHFNTFRTQHAHNLHCSSSGVHTHNLTRNLNFKPGRDFDHYIHIFMYLYLCIYQYHRSVASKFTSKNSFRFNILIPTCSVCRNSSKIKTKNKSKSTMKKRGKPIANF